VKTERRHGKEKGWEKVAKSTFFPYYAFIRKIEDQLLRAFRHSLYEACDAAPFNNIFEFTGIRNGFHRPW
jgi:hypothetical protein